MPEGPQRQRLSEPMQLDLDGFPWRSRLGFRVRVYRVLDLGLEDSGSNPKPWWGLASTQMIPGTGTKACEWHHFGIHFGTCGLF